MEIDGKVVIYGIVIVLVLVLVFVSLNIKFLVYKNQQKDLKSEDNIPSKCKIPYGEDVKSWKEHLSHHSDLEECLKYFN